jgi:hypothetical protein
VKPRLPFACVWLAVALGSTGTLLAAPGQVKGIVRDDYGVPVADIGVEALPARGYDISPPRARTDKQGLFILDLTRWATESPSKWRIYVRDEARFYPRPSTFYGESEKSASTVTISSGTSPNFVDLRLGGRAGAIRVKVSDAMTGEVVLPKFELAWASDPQKA